MKKIHNLKKTVIISGSAAIFVLAVGAGAYAIHPKDSVAHNSSIVASTTTPAKGEAPKSESTPVVEESEKVETPTSQVTAPVTNETPVVATTDAQDAEANKRCELVNLTIDHIKTYLSANGRVASREDILHDLGNIPQNHLANLYYSGCVAAGKTQAL